MPALPLSRGRARQAPARAVGRERESGGGGASIRVGKEGGKLSPFAGDAALHTEDPAGATQRLLESIIQAGCGVQLGEVSGVKRRPSSYRPPESIEAHRTPLAFTKDLQSTCLR